MTRPPGRILPGRNRPGPASGKKRARTSPAGTARSGHVGDEDQVEGALYGAENALRLRLESASPEPKDAQSERAFGREVKRNGKRPPSHRVADQRTGDG